MDELIIHASNLHVPSFNFGAAAALLSRLLLHIAVFVTSQAGQAVLCVNDLDGSFFLVSLLLEVIRVCTDHKQPDTR